MSVGGMLLSCRPANANELANRRQPSESCCRFPGPRLRYDLLRLLMAIFFELQALRLPQSARQPPSEQQGRSGEIASVLARQSGRERNHPLLSHLAKCR